MRVEFVALDWIWVGLFIALMVLCGVIFYRLDKLTTGTTLFLLFCAAAVSAEAAVRTAVSLDDGWSFRHANRADWYPAAVPGVVHLDLLANELIADPFWGTNEETLQWIGKADWVYRKRFAVAPTLLRRRNLELVFDGLDTYAEVRLNGERVLEADNMYRRWRIPVAGRLRPANNELEIVFRSPIARDLPRVEADGYRLPASNDKGEQTSPYTRKAPYSFGWDWGPRLVTSGIWKPVRLEAWDEARLIDLFVRQIALGDDVARLEADFAVLADRRGRGPARLDVLVDGAAAAGVEVRLAEGAGRHTVAFDIPTPRLWWPNGLGDQPLYDVSGRLVVDGVAVDAAETRIGLRTIELRRRPDEWGESFEFVVNGVPVFAKGANWIPADSLLPRVTRERYEDLLGAARDANMNMLRVWAGGIYESDEFFDVADEMGLLVWEDFHFSTSLYPADPDFLASVEAEAEEAIRRLRNHPSLAIWCGNNEVETAWHHWGWKRRLPRWLFDDYRKLFHELLPRVVAEHDPTRPYWPSSPSAGGEQTPGAAEVGDMHYWGVWHGGEPFAAFERNPTRFMSEYGFQSFPELATILSFAPPDQLAIDSPAMLGHQKHPRGNQLIREYMLRDYPEPRSFESFLYLSQVLQAEGMKIGAEFLRRSRPRTMGSLYWQLNDVWPVASWSSIDYFGRWKALHFYARRFYADLLLSTAERDGAIEVYVVSDHRQPVPARLEARLLDFAGETLWERVRELDVAPLSSRVEISVARDELLAGRDPAGVFLDLRLSREGKELAANRRFFLPPKNLALERPAIDRRVVARDGRLAVVLAADRLARAVRLRFEGTAEGTFEDNYFDLLPGRPVEVGFTGAAAIGADELARGLAVDSLVDAFPTAAAQPAAVEEEGQ